MFRMCVRIMLLMYVVTSSHVFAAATTLIGWSGGKATPGLAKAWKKVKDGEYEFDLDPAAEVKAGTKLTGQMVKDSLEGKLGSSMGVKVAVKNPTKVSVLYKGDETKFLESVSKTKIRSGKDVELALESSVSDGGIRAKAADRPPTEGEVKGTVIKVEKGTLTVRVSESKSPKVKTGEKVVVRGEVSGIKKEDGLFFKPEKKDQDQWIPMAGSLKR